jgi:hypothetical protein
MNVKKFEEKGCGVEFILYAGVNVCYLFRQPFQPYSSLFIIESLTLGVPVEQAMLFNDLPP